MLQGDERNNSLCSCQSHHCMKYWHYMTIICRGSRLQMAVLFIFRLASIVFIGYMQTLSMLLHCTLSRVHWTGWTNSMEGKRTTHRIEIETGIHEIACKICAVYWACWHRQQLLHITGCSSRGWGLTCEVSKRWKRASAGVKFPLWPLPPTKCHTHAEVENRAGLPTPVYFNTDDWRCEFLRLYLQ